MLKRNISNLIYLTWILALFYAVKILNSNIQENKLNQSYFTQRVGVSLTKVLLLSQ